MTNEEYQRQAAERSRQADEARRRQSLEDSNRHERERAARNAQIQKENYSRSLGSKGLNPPLLGPGVDRATYNRARQGYDANQRMMAQFNQAVSPTRSYGGSSSGSGSGSGKGKAAGAGFVVVLIIVAVIAFSGGSGTSTNSTTSNTDSSSQPDTTQSSSSSTPYPPASIAQPAPIAQDQPQPDAPPDSSAASNTLPAAPGDNAVPDVAFTAPAAESAPSSLPFGRTLSASRNGANNGCKHGDLVLEVSTVTFTCPSDPSKSVTVSADQVKEVDNNGIIAFPKEKYHFDIDGLQKPDVHDLFVQWLENARRTPSSVGN